MTIRANVFKDQWISKQMFQWSKQMYSQQTYSMKNEYHTKQESMDIVAKVFNAKRIFQMYHRKRIQWKMNITAKVFKNQWISQQMCSMNNDYHSKLIQWSLAMIEDVFNQYHSKRNHWPKRHRNAFNGLWTSQKCIQWTMNIALKDHWHLLWVNAYGFQ